MEVCLDKSDNFFSQSDCFAPQTKKSRRRKPPQTKAKIFSPNQFTPLTKAIIFQSIECSAVSSLFIPDWNHAASGCVY
jgi:hypothetical protein